MAKLIRQGDVLLVPIDALPAGDLAEVPRENGRIILAEGENTGHAHAVLEPDARLMEHEGERYLVAPTGATVRHEEHAPLGLDAGAYRLVHQREYSPQVVRRVID